MTQSSDNVNHPSHYTSHPSGVECIQIVEHMTFNLGNAVKYLWRSGLKEAAQGRFAQRIEDLKKARWYIDREIAKLEKYEGDPIKTPPSLSQHPPSTPPTVPPQIYTKAAFPGDEP